MEFRKDLRRSEHWDDSGGSGYKRRLWRQEAGSMISIISRENVERDLLYVHPANPDLRETKWMICRQWKKHGLSANEDAQIRYSSRKPRVSLCITDSALLTQRLSDKSLSSDDSPLSPSATPSLSLPAQNSPSHKTFPPKTLSLSIGWVHGIWSLSVILSIHVSLHFFPLHFFACALDWRG